MSAVAERLALHGGAPVRAELLPTGRGIERYGEEERAAVLEVLESRSLFRYYGPDLRHKVAGFEAALAEVLGAGHAVATSSGTAALRAAFAALGIGCGDEVVVPAFTFVATVNAVVCAGAVPVFAEIDDSLGLDPATVDAVIGPRTGAVVPVHLENVGCDMEPLLAVTRRAGVAVVEDAAQAIGATYRGRALGTLGDLGAFSLQLEKTITAGEGGAVVTDDERLLLRAARYTDQGGQFVTGPGGGRGEELVEPFVGENLRMTEIAGALAGVQLGRLAGLLADMRTVKARILATLGDVPGLVPRRLPDPDGDGGSSITWFLPTAEVAAETARALRAEGVPAARFYAGRPVYATPAVLARQTASGKGGPWHCGEHPTDVAYRIGMCPRTEDLAARNVTVACAPGWGPAECDVVAEAVAKVAAALVP